MSDVTSAITPSSGFFKRPEGKFGLIIPAIVIGAVIYFFGSSIGNFIVNAVDNMLHLAIVGTCLVAFLWVLFDSKFRNMAFYLYRSLMRTITSAFIDIDPIGVLKTYKDRMVSKLNEMSASLSQLKAQRIKVTRLIDSNAKEYDNELHLVQQAKIQNNTRAEALEGKQLVRLGTMKDRYLGDLNRITLLCNVLDRYYGLCQDTITDMDREIKFRQDERDYSKASRSVVRNATAILKGLPEKEMWDDGMAALERQYTEAIGEVENFLDVTKNILSQADLQDGADSAKAMELLDQWQKKNSTVALGGQGSQVSKADIIQDAANQLAGSGSQKQYVPISGGDDYLTMVKVESSI
jgi:hypothetical protein